MANLPVNSDKQLRTPQDLTRSGQTLTTYMLQWSTGVTGDFKGYRVTLVGTSGNLLIYSWDEFKESHPGTTEERIAMFIDMLRFAGFVEIQESMAIMFQT